MFDSDLNVITFVDSALAPIDDQGYLLIYRKNYRSDDHAVFGWKVLATDAFTLAESNGQSLLHRPMDDGKSTGVLAAMADLIDFLIDHPEGTEAGIFGPLLLPWVAASQSELEELRDRLREHLGID